MEQFDDLAAGFTAMLVVLAGDVSAIFCSMPACASEDHSQQPKYAITIHANQRSSTVKCLPHIDLETRLQLKVQSCRIGWDRTLFVVKILWRSGFEKRFCWVVAFSGWDGHLTFCDDTSVKYVRWRHGTLSLVLEAWDR